jgi:hypothetical protein
MYIEEVYRVCAHGIHAEISKPASCLSSAVQEALSVLFRNKDIDVGAFRHVCVCVCVRERERECVCV